MTTRTQRSDSAVHTVQPKRRHIAKIVTAAVVAGSPLVAIQATASAAPTTALPKSLQAFAHCPVHNSKVALCLAASTGGTFHVGSATLTLPSPATISLGIAFDKTGNAVAVLPTDGSPALKSPTVVIPAAGGLVQVGATPTLGGLPTLSVANLLTQSGVAISLPLVVELSNPLLGSNCTLGTPGAPLTVDLTDGTTNPPPPNTPVTGSKGKVVLKGNGETILQGDVLVDNAFAAPGASGCGPFGIEDGLVNALEGLPSPAGTNSAVLSGNTMTIPASVIRKYLG